MKMNWPETPDSRIYNDKRYPVVTVAGQVTDDCDPMRFRKPRMTVPAGLHAHTQLSIVNIWYSCATASSCVNQIQSEVCEKLEGT